MGVQKYETPTSKDALLVEWFALTAGNWKAANMLLTGWKICERETFEENLAKL